MEGREQREHQRVQVVDQNIHAKIASSKMMKILDLSIGGALLQTETRLNVSKEYTVQIEHNGKIYSIKGLIVWSVLKECKMDHQGNCIPVYRSGMQFLHVPEEMLGIIALIGNNQKQQANDATSGEEYYHLSIDSLDISSEEREHIEAHLSY